MRAVQHLQDLINHGTCFKPCFRKYILFCVKTKLTVNMQCNSQHLTEVCYVKQVQSLLLEHTMLKCFTSIHVCFYKYTQIPI